MGVGLFWSYKCCNIKFFLIFFGGGGWLGTKIFSLACWKISSHDLLSFPRTTAPHPPFQTHGLKYVFLFSVWSEACIFVLNEWKSLKIAKFILSSVIYGILVHWFINNWGLLSWFLVWFLSSEAQNREQGLKWFLSSEPQNRVWKMGH